MLYWTFMLTRGWPALLLVNPNMIQLVGVLYEGVEVANPIARFVFEVEASPQLTLPPDVEVEALVLSEDRVKHREFIELTMVKSSGTPVLNVQMSGVVVSGAL